MKEQNPLHLENVADLLWLSKFIGRQSVVAENIEDKKQDNQKPKIENDEVENDENSSEPEMEEPQDNLEVHTDNQDDENSSHTKQKKAKAIQSPKKLALSNYREWEKAFKFINLKQPSRNKYELDEDKTVENIASLGIFDLVFKKVQEKSFFLTIVIDRAETMELWDELIKNFEQMLFTMGVFAKISIYYWDTKDNKPKLYADRELKKEISEKVVVLDGKRNLVWILSDCIAPSWRSSEAFQSIKRWSQKSFTSILQMFPKEMWMGTVLFKGKHIRLSTTSFNPSNKKLKAQFSKKEKNTLKIPIISFDPYALQSWAKVVVNARNNSISGIELEEVEFPLIVSNSKKEITTEMRMKRFYSQASPIAQKLAFYMSVLPVDFQVTRILQEELLPQSNQAHVAEVFLGGLIKRTKKTDSVHYDFYPKIREELNANISADKSFEIMSNMSDFVSNQLGIGFDFKALITDPNGAFEGDVEISSESLAYAKLASSVLKRKGGNLYTIAQAIDKKVSDLETEVFPKVLKEKIIIKPALYKTITEKVLISPARTEWKKTTSDNPDFKEISELIDVPPKYKMVTKKVMVKPEIKEKIEIYLDDTEEKIMDMVISELLSIGWNKKNILQNYKISNKRVDILLRHNEKNLIVIGVKAPRFDVKSGLDHAILYGKELGIDYVYSTNGVDIYEYSIRSEKGGLVDEYPSLEYCLNNIAVEDKKEIILYKDTTLKEINLVKIVNYLNKICTYLTFKVGKAPFILKEKEINIFSYKELDVLLHKESQDSFKSILMTDKAYDDNFFFKENPKYSNLKIFSSSNWSYLTSLSKNNGLFYMIAYILALDIDGAVQHDESNTNCIYNYLWDKSDIDKNMRNAQICESCMVKISHNIPLENQQILDDLNSILRVVHKASKRDLDIFENKKDNIDTKDDEFLMAFNEFLKSYEKAINKKSDFHIYAQHCVLQSWTTVEVFAKKIIEMHKKNVSNDKKDAFSFVRELTRKNNPYIDDERIGRIFKELQRIRNRVAHNDLIINEKHELKKIKNDLLYIKYFFDEYKVRESLDYIVEKNEGEIRFDYSNNNGQITIKANMGEFTLNFSKASDTSIYYYSDAKNIDSVARIEGYEDIDEFITNNLFKIEDYDDSSWSRTIQLDKKHLGLLKNKFGYVIIKVLSIKNDTRNDEVDEVVFEFKVLPRKELMEKDTLASLIEKHENDTIGKIRREIHNLGNTIQFLEKYRETIIDRGIDALLLENSVYIYQLKNDTVQFRKSLNNHFQWMIEYSNNPNSSKNNFDDYKGDDIVFLNQAYCDFYEFLLDSMKNIGKDIVLKRILEDYIFYIQKYYSITETITLKNGKSLTLEFIKVELENDKTLYVGKYPVTFEEYDRFCEEKNKKKINKYIEKEARDKSYVVKVTLEEAIGYCEWLSEKSINYRLPMSEEWEVFIKDVILTNIQEICLNKCVKGIWNNIDLEENIKHSEDITLLPLKEVGFRVVYEIL